ncbi:MAG: hypothetical protein WDN48_02425 [Pseudolabrys sp.]
MSHSGLPQKENSGELAAKSVSSAEPVKQPDENADAINFIFDDWKSVQAEISLYDRILISIIAISYAQSESSGDLKQYLHSIKPELKVAIKDRAQKLLEKYDEKHFEALKRERIEITWVEAAKFGIDTRLEDFERAQIDSFRNLDAHVRDKTSLKSQAMVAFGTALALAIFVGAVRPAVTIWDDIKHQIWTEKK